MLDISIYYLFSVDRTGTTSQLKDVMKLLLESRPENPIAFLAE